MPLEIASPLLAYIRRHKEDWVLVVTPLIREGMPVPETFSITLPEGSPSDWTNIFTGEQATTGGRKETISGEQATIGGEKETISGEETTIGGEEKNVLTLNGDLSKFPVALFVGRSS